MYLNIRQKLFSVFEGGRGPSIISSKLLREGQNLDPCAPITVKSLAQLVQKEA